MFALGDPSSDPYVAYESNGADPHPEMSRLCSFLDPKGTHMLHEAQLRSHTSASADVERGAEFGHETSLTASRNIP